MDAPILVTGSHRSGTTWVGKVLARSADLAYLHEPFNPGRAPGWMGGPVPHWYLYVCEENEGLWRTQVERLLRLRYPIGSDLARIRTPRQMGQTALEWPRSLRRRARVLLKDPIALFSAEWLARRFDARVVVMIRHPLAFAGSLKRLDWRFDFRNWAEQDLLLRDLLAPYAAKIRDHVRRERDVIDQSVLMWNAIHHVIAGYRERHPGWAFVRHEDLAEDPIRGFQELCEHLGLPWGDRARRAVERSSSRRNPKEVPRWLHRSVKRDSRAATRTWVHRLTEEERRRVLSGTAEVAGRFYETRAAR